MCIEIRKNEPKDNTSKKINVTTKKTNIFISHNMQSTKAVGEINEILKLRHKKIVEKQNNFNTNAEQGSQNIYGNP